MAPKNRSIALSIEPVQNEFADCRFLFHESDRSIAVDSRYDDDTEKRYVVRETHHIREQPNDCFGDPPLPRPTQAGKKFRTSFFQLNP